MASTVDIVNGGLQHLGARQIVDLDEQSKEAREASLAWPRVREAVIRLGTWNSTTTRTLVSPVSETPAYGFDYYYDFPEDCLGIFDIDSEDPEEDWRVEGRRMLCDLDGPLGILYAKDVTDAAQFDPALVQALSLAIAVDLCEALTQSTKKAEALAARFSFMVTAAGISDGREQNPARFAEDSWITARYRR